MTKQRSGGIGRKNLRTMVRAQRRVGGMRSFKNSKPLHARKGAVRVVKEPKSAGDMARLKIGRYYIGQRAPVAIVRAQASAIRRLRVKKARRRNK